MYLLKGLAWTRCAKCRNTPRRRMGVSYLCRWTRVTHGARRGAPDKPTRPPWTPAAPQQGPDGKWGHACLRGQAGGQAPRYCKSLLGGHVWYRLTLTRPHQKGEAPWQGPVWASGGNWGAVEQGGGRKHRCRGHEILQRRMEPQSQAGRSSRKHSGWDHGKEPIAGHLLGVDLHFPLPPPPSGQHVRPYANEEPTAQGLGNRCTEVVAGTGASGPEPSGDGGWSR